jgi:CheY-like chemotaxis protein
MEQNAHILIVDDYALNLKVASTYLKHKGYKIALAVDGKSALEIVTTDHIDLILLDVMMPDMDGYEVNRILQKDFGHLDIPVIFLTARTETEAIIEAFNTGAVDFISKPFMKEELYARVKTHIQLKKIKDFLKIQLKDPANTEKGIIEQLLLLG